MARRAIVDRLLGLPPTPRCEVRVETDLAVPMRDGVTLRADRYSPEGPGPAPLVLMRTPYGRRRVWKRLYCLPLARRGYQVVVQSCRGTEDSGGRLTPFDERDDGHDTAAWLRAQPWYPGRFATFGPSYLGLAQWASADGAPDDLAAITPVLTSSRLVRALSFGGAFSLESWLRWSALIAAQEDRGAGVGALLRSRGRRVANALRHLPVGAADRVATGRDLDWWRPWVAAADAAASGAEAADAAAPSAENADVGHADLFDRLDWSAAVGETSAPVLMVTSWYDLFAPWQLADWQELPDTATPRRLVVSPWVHEDPKLAKLYMRECVAWLDAHLRGVSDIHDHGDVHGRGDGHGDGPVRYYLTGADEWCDAPTWPPPGVQPRRWYLHPAGGLSTARPPADATPTCFRYDPADPTPSLGGPSARGNPQVRQHKVEARPDVVTFTTSALDEPVDVVGAARATVHLASSVDHTDVVVRLCDVDPKGRSVHIADGIRRVHPDRCAADADGVRAVTVDLWPAGHRFRRGHRIRVQVASAAFPRFARNLGTGEPAVHATRSVPADQQVFHTAARPSQVELPTRTAAPARP